MASKIGHSRLGEPLAAYTDNLRLVAVATRKKHVSTATVCGKTAFGDSTMQGSSSSEDVVLSHGRRATVQ